MPNDELSEAEFHRYARHLILDEVGEEGQAKLRKARILVVGAGGLGSPALLYLAAAGIGTLGIVDDDAVDLTNLQRQVAHTTDTLGWAKVDSAARTIGQINPHVRVIRHKLRLETANADLVGEYDLVLDGSDNFATRYVLADACFKHRKPMIWASLLRFEGQLSVFKPWTGGPCYRCLFAEAPPPGLVPRCEEAGILGAVAGVMGTLQAVEALKEILGLGDSLSGRLVLYDALSSEFRSFKAAKDPACPTCGTSAQKPPG
jgi:molybdopterin/thiamine biosynthesis adenylyltransferase